MKLAQGRRLQSTTSSDSTVLQREGGLQVEYVASGSEYGDQTVLAVEDRPDDSGASTSAASGQTEIELAVVPITHICGDRRRSSAESCDDGNTASLDGCDSLCRTESGWRCTSSNPYGSGIGGIYTCEPLCGDGLRVGGENCDDGAQADGDGCSAACVEETGWKCTGGSVRSSDNCTTVCGDGLRAGVEVCDDGNRVDFDGCSMDCDAIEEGFTCGDGGPASADMCQACDSSCATCRGASQISCTSCAASSPFRSGWQRGFACVADCTPLGAWGQASTPPVCSPCSPLCGTCSGPDSTQCLSCDVASVTPFLQSSQCVAQCNENAYALMLQDTGMCMPCDTTCKECSGPSSTDCSSCSSSFPFFQRVPFQSGACVAACDSGSFADEHNACTECHYTCGTCSGAVPDACTSCEHGSTLTDGICVSKCPDSSYYTEDESCAACYHSCLACSGPGAGDCIACGSDAALYNGTCLEECPGGFYVSSSGRCVPCDASCSLCSGPSSTSCTSCRDGAFKHFGECRTSGCPSSYFANVVTRTCQRCYGACASCDGPSQSDCLSCSWLTPLLFERACYNVCPTHSYRDGSVCKLCHEDCASCSSYGVCTSCRQESRIPHLVAGGCTCRDGFRQASTSCDEINECGEGTHDCFSAKSCINTAGGYQCRCSRGYIGDGRLCEDTNEVHTWSLPTTTTGHLLLTRHIAYMY